MHLPRTHKHARIELLPLMDIVFLILVFLVYAMLSMVAQTGLPVSLPAAKSGEPDRKVAVALTIQQDGSLWVDKSRIHLTDLARAINIHAQNNGDFGEKQPDVQIYADAGLPYHELYTVLEALKQAGIRKISLQARREGN